MKICFKCNQLGNDDELNCRFCSAELEEIVDSDNLPDISDVIGLESTEVNEPVIEVETLIDEEEYTDATEVYDFRLDDIYSGLKKEIRLLKIVILFFVVIVIQLLVIISLL